MNNRSERTRKERQQNGEEKKGVYGETTRKERNEGAEDQITQQRQREITNDKSS